MTVTFAPAFHPLPLLGNPHVQTVLGAFLPGGKCSRPSAGTSFACRTATPFCCTRTSLLPGGLASLSRSCCTV